MLEQHTKKKNRMNIIKVNSSLSYGGAETQIINMSKELVNQGHTVTIITTSDNAPRASELENTGVNLICLKKRRKLDLALIQELRKQFKKIKPDIIHAYLYDAEFFSRLAVIGLNIPLINSERNDAYNLNTNQKVGHFLTRRLVDAVIANSYAGCSHAIGKYPNVKKSNFHVVWNGIDTEKVAARITAYQVDLKKELFPDSKVKLAVMVASIKHQKNHELALKVADKLINLDDNWRVLFVGDQLTDSKNEYKTKIMNLYQKSTHKDKIMYLGNRNDVVEILQQADISFLTSHHEGFPNTALESMTVGTPVVTTSFSDIKRIAVEPWLVNDEHNADTFVNTLVKAEAHREALSHKSKAWVLNNCSMTIATQNLLNVYRGYVNEATK
jgi:glycosyltransferase involved in cell wall biosynthesis